MREHTRLLITDVLEQHRDKVLDKDGQVKMYHFTPLYRLLYDVLFLKKVSFPFLFALYAKERGQGLHPETEYSWFEYEDIAGWWVEDVESPAYRQEDDDVAFELQEEWHFGDWAFEDPSIEEIQQIADSLFAPPPPEAKQLTLF